MDASKHGLTTKLQASASASDDTLVIPQSDFNQFIPADGDYYYATLYTSTAREIVIVRGVQGGRLRVTRGQDGTTPITLPAGSCLKAEWNPAALREFIASMGQPENTISPGVYCINCTTCLTLSGDGRITNVDGAEQC